MSTVFHITRAFTFLMLASFASTALSVTVGSESGGASLDGVWAHPNCQYAPFPYPPDFEDFDTLELTFFQGNTVENRLFQFSSKDDSCSGSRTLIRLLTATLSKTEELESPGWMDNDELVPPPPRQDGNGLLDPTPLVTMLTFLLSGDEVGPSPHYIDDTAEIWYLYRKAGEDDVPSIFMGLEPLIKTDLVLSPIPIPTAFWLFGTALIGFVGISRKRKVA